MRSSQSILGIGAGFLLAMAVVAGVSFLGPVPATKNVVDSRTSLAQSDLEGASIASSEAVAISPSSIEGISTSSPSSLLIVLSPIIAALAVGIAANRLYARRADLE